MSERKARIWLIELPEGRGWERVTAETARIESGALVLSNGDIFSPEFVAAYGPRGWAYVHPTDEDDEDEED